MTLIEVIIAAEYPQPSIVCPKSERRELTANETATRTIYYSVPAAASTEKARNQAPALHWQISPQRAMGSKSNSYGANDVVELTAPGKYKFTYSSGSGLSPRSSCQFTVEIQGNVRAIWFQFILIRVHVCI